MAKKQKKGITKLRLINWLLISFVLTASVFGVLYYLKLNPNDYAPVSKSSQPGFAFAVYGENKSKLAKPMDMAIKHNLVYVTDAEANKVLVYNTDGKFKFSFGKAGVNKGELNFPYGIDIDELQRVYVSDMKNHRIQIYDLNGKFMNYFTPIENKDNYLSLFPGYQKYNDDFVSPAGLTIKNNLLYVVDIMKSKVYVFGLNGEKKMIFGSFGEGKGQFRYPNGVAADDKGNVYVADTGNNRIQIFNQKGKYLRTVNSAEIDDGTKPFASPRGIFITDNNVMFVVNNVTNQVWACDLKGKLLYRFGEKGDQNSQFNYPVGICIDKNRLYVADSNNHGIKVFKY